MYGLKWWGGWQADGYAFLDIEALVQSDVMEDAGRPCS